MIDAERTMRVVFCWAEVAGYSAACFQALRRRPALDVHVIHPERLLPRPNPFSVAPMLEGVSHEMFDASRVDIDTYLLQTVASRRPDVVALCGWIYWPYTRLVKAKALADARIVLGMDTPWRGTLAQRLARFRLAAFVDGLDLVVTAGERSSEYARRIGVPSARLRAGFYGFDFERYAAAARRRESPPPRRFLFTGRYAKEKDLVTLLRAYEAYRNSVTAPWSLTCAGAGPEAYRLKDVPGVTDAGFRQPDQLADLFASHGAFVLPSLFEPWGVVIAEAAAAGLPVICSTACGAAADVVRPYYNGVIVPQQDVDALARALRWMHDHESELAEMGRRGQALADAFSAEAWAKRWHQYLLEVMGGRGDEQADGHGRVNDGPR